MKNKGKRIFLALASAAIHMLFSGCISMFERTVQVLDGSAFAERRISSYSSQNMEITKVQNRDGEHSVIITLNQFPAISLRGTLPDGQNLFFLTAMYYLCGNEHGWNEWRLDISAAGNLELGDETAVFTIHSGIETVQISAGRIHRFDTRITGDEALTSLRNRQERILSLSEWMLKQYAPQGLSQRFFDRHWKPILFPEIVSARRQPVNWRQQGDIWARAEDIRWNISYTERVFPEELQEVRNSGTLLRDWEEALSWIYLKYEWENIGVLLSAENILQRTR